MKYKIVTDGSCDLPPQLCLEKDITVVPFYVSFDSEAYEKEITVWSEKDIPVNPDEIGINASPTKVFRSFTPEPKGRGMMVEGTPKEAAAKVVEELKKKHFL